MISMEEKAGYGFIKQEEGAEVRKAEIERDRNLRATMIRSFGDLKKGRKTKPRARV